MKLSTLTFLLSLTFSTFASAQNYGNADNSQTINMLRDKIDSLERRVERLEDRVFAQQNQQPSNPNTTCSSLDYVRLLKDNIFPVAEKLCPYQCAKLLVDYQKNNQNVNYKCGK